MLPSDRTKLFDAELLLRRAGRLVAEVGFDNQQTDKELNGQLYHAIRHITIALEHSTNAYVIGSRTDTPTDSGEVSTISPVGEPSQRVVPVSGSGEAHSSVNEEGLRRVSGWKSADSVLLPPELPNGNRPS